MRTLALIERTTIRRRQDEMLKVYHADVRAVGRENAEISLALMERAHMAAVIVGPMQPQAIDAMLTALHEAASQPDWHCPSLLFLLPPARCGSPTGSPASTGRRRCGVEMPMSR